MSLLNVNFFTQSKSLFSTSSCLNLPHFLQLSLTHPPLHRLCQMYFFKLPNAFPYSPPPHRLCGGEFKATSHLWNSVTETQCCFFGKSTSTAGNHNRIDHNTIPLLTNGWNRTSTCSGGAVAILFCHGSSLHQWWSPPQSPPTTNLTAAFSFFFSRKKLRLSAKLYVLGLINAARFMLICRRGGVVIAKQGKRRKLFTTVVHIRKLTWKYCFIFCPIIFHMLSNYFPIQEHTQDPT